MKKMRKNGLILIVTLLCVFGLLSCIEGDNVEEGQALGVLKFDENLTPVLYSTRGPVYSPSINSFLSNYEMIPGGCYIFSYRFDAGLPENAMSVVDVNGYYTITINAFQEIDRYTVNPYIDDTSKVMTDEVAISSVYENNAYSTYIEGYLFIYQSVVQPSDLLLNWYMSFDFETMMPTVENGVNYYDVFVRATKKNEGTKSNVDMKYLNAYNMESYLHNAANREKSLIGSSYNESTSIFLLRFNYASEIDDDTQKITWKSKTVDVGIASFL